MLNALIAPLEQCQAGIGLGCASCQLQAHGSPVQAPDRDRQLSDRGESPYNGANPFVLTWGEFISAAFRGQNLNGLPDEHPREIFARLADVRGLGRVYRGDVMKRQLRRFDSALQNLGFNRPAATTTSDSRATVAQPQLPRPHQPATAPRRPAPYRYAPGRRQKATTTSNSTPARSAAPPNPSVKLSRPYETPQANIQLAPLPQDAQQRSGAMVLQRSSSNPALAIHLLREIEEVIVGWQRELKQILVQVQNLYLEGPMVNGWLESLDQDANRGSAPLRVLPTETYPSYQGRVRYELPRPAYRLCGRNEQGQIWSKVCPPEQVAAVSMAIARYQKLCQLLKKKQSLEHRLTNIAETLVRVHHTLKQ